MVCHVVQEEGLDARGAEVGRHQQAISPDIKAIVSFLGKDLLFGLLANSS